MQFRNFPVGVNSGWHSTGVDIKRDSFGGALQFGVDIPLSGNMSLNFDVKKVYLGTDVSVGGVNQGSFKVDPLLVGLGIGWRF